MTSRYDIPEEEKTAARKLAAPCSRAADSTSVVRLTAMEEAEEEAVRKERRGWIVPAILCLLLTGASFYYYHQKLARESRTELKVIRADAGLRKAHLSALQQQVQLLESQEPLPDQPLAKSQAEESPVPRLEE